MSTALLDTPSTTQGGEQTIRVMHSFGITRYLATHHTGGVAVLLRHPAREHATHAGVVCSKVARYAERVHHPDRLLSPLRRRGSKERW